MEEILIPERLKTVREKEGITMAEASRRLNLSKIGYCRYEYGERTPSIQTVEIIAQCFGTSVDYLTGVTDNPAPDYVIVSKRKAPELYELVKKCMDSDEKQTRRLLAYMEILNHENERN